MGGRRFNPKTFKLPESFCPLCDLAIHPSVRMQLTLYVERCPHCLGEFGHHCPWPRQDVAR